MCFPYCLSWYCCNIYNPIRFCLQTKLKLTMIQLGKFVGGWCGWHKLPIFSSPGLDQKVKNINSQKALCILKSKTCFKIPITSFWRSNNTGLFLVVKLVEIANSTARIQFAHIPATHPDTSRYASRICISDMCIQCQTHPTYQYQWPLTHPRIIRYRYIFSDNKK